MINITQLISKETHKYPKNIAVIDGARSITYGQLLETVKKTAQELEAAGIKRFTLVALLCADSIEYIVLSLAILKLNAVVVPVPLGSSEDEIQNLLKQIKVKFIIFKQGTLLPVDKQSDRRGRLNVPYPVDNLCTDRNVPGLNNFIIRKFKAAKKLDPQFYKINPAFIRFSSGTTGRSKGVLLSHRAIIERTQAANKGLKIKPGEKIIWVLSMSFHFVVTILLFLRRGATIILSGSNFPQGLLQNLKNYRANFIYASPLHYHMLTALNVPKKSLKDIRLAVSTAVKLPEKIAANFKAKFGFELAETYGIIEAGLPALNASGKSSKRGSVGKILPDYKLKLLNRDKNGIGEICIKGKGMFDAYFSPWIPKKEALSGGWFNTGDLGRLDKDGFLYILGRSKQVINFNGMKIFPAEVESVLNWYGPLEESLAYGKAHPEYGQLPVAKIVLKKKGAPVNIEDLKAFCYQHLAAYKVPKEFEIVDRLERTASGKVIHRVGDV